MPRLVDTTIRLLSQEPLAGRLPTAEIFRLAEVLDGAGFACLEVSGGGVFDSAVRRGVESPWERIRALKARTTTPLGLALRGRFLVGSRPVGADFVRRFVASAAENGIDVFRLHDPLNDVSNLREAGEAIVGAGREFHAGLVYSPGGEGAADALVEQSRKLPELNATRALIHDPTGGAAATPGGRARVARRGGLRAPGRLLLSGRVGKRPRRLDRGRARGRRPDRVRRLSPRLVAAPCRGRVPLGGARRDGLRDRHRHRPAVEASDVVDEHLGDEPVAPLAPRLAVRAAEYDLPTGLVGALDAQMRSHGAGDRLNEVLDELQKIRGGRLAATRGADRADPRVAGVDPRPLGAALRHRRRRVPVADSGPLRGTAERDRRDRRACRGACQRRHAAADDPPSAEDVRQEAEGLAASEEELVLIALFGEEAEQLLQNIRSRHSREDTIASGVEQSRAERIRELVQIVQESGIGEVEIEDNGMRVSVRRAEEVPVQVGGAPLAEEEPDELPLAAPSLAVGIRVESPMVGVFYRAAEPGLHAVRRAGRRRRAGADAVPARGDEALQRAEGRDDRSGDRGPRRGRSAGRVRTVALRARADRRTARALSGPPGY